VVFTGTTVSSTTKTECHDIAQIFLIVALNTMKLLIDTKTYAGNSTELLIDTETYAGNTIEILIDTETYAANTIEILIDTETYAGNTMEILIDTETYAGSIYEDILGNYYTRYKTIFLRNVALEIEMTYFWGRVQLSTILLLEDTKQSGNHL
jgi:uncharacterized ubiquitin-like protein YukD